MRTYSITVSKETKEMLEVDVVYYVAALDLMDACQAVEENKAKNEFIISAKAQTELDLISDKISKQIRS